jgi:anti-sigma factor RsiW
MLDCREAQLLLAPLEADELDAAQAEVVIGHLAACGACRAELRRERELRGLLGGLPLEACPPAATAAAEAAALAADAGLGPRPPRRPQRRLWAGTVGLGLAAALAALVLLPGRFSDERSGPLADGDSTATTLAAAAVPAPEAAEMAAARRDLITSLTLTARILDRAGRRTMNDVFTERLPDAVSISLNRNHSTNTPGS